MNWPSALKMDLGLLRDPSVPSLGKPCKSGVAKRDSTSEEMNDERCCDEQPSRQYHLKLKMATSRMNVKQASKPN